MIDVYTSDRDVEEFESVPISSSIIEDISVPGLSFEEVLERGEDALEHLSSSFNNVPENSTASQRDRIKSGVIAEIEESLNMEVF